MIQKIELNFTHSVNLGPIIVNIITKNKNEIKIDIPVVTELATSCLPSQHFNRLEYFSLSLSDIPFVPFYQLPEHIGPHRFFINTF